ncbi:glycosyltransferase [Silicimonas algicola]|uniref:Glycosyltransferase involved in cell wall biosynthesis n=1 Tax=Silicimonas algicola TaxID=1826607 RepID=A0A316GEP1_9RHOB|nr:glycosyltransferase family 4 protein [Silicimonas algicola]AZQ66749.1 glycosyltransferase [Silicimonas algicola]PWK53137.1 glycosyltransferase involved in cell wall biosynthesis [Silicimonas algicola]
MTFAVVSSHPIQYYAPLFRELARRIDVQVFYLHQVTAHDQAEAGFDLGFEWDVDLLSGYESSFLENAAIRPGLHHFRGVSTPGIAAALKQGRFRAVLLTGWHLWGYAQAIMSAKRLGIPVMVRGDSQLQTKRSFAKRATKAVAYPAFLRTFDAALYVGTRSKDYWRHYLYPGERLFFSPHCVDNAWFAERSSAEAGTTLRQKLGIAPHTKVLLFAGKLQPFKRPLDVIDAGALLRRNGRDVQLLVAGSGELDAAMWQRADAAGVPLHMLGFQNQSAMPAAYAAADLLVLPSSSETWGLVANEALACGTPVVVSDACGCAPDLAADGIAGATFPTGNVRALAERLSQLLDQPPDNAQIAKKISRYSLSNAVDGIETAFQAIRRMAPQ